MALLHRGVSFQAFSISRVQLHMTTLSTLRYDCRNEHAIEVEQKLLRVCHPSRVKLINRELTSPLV
jgi:hypothetical protein